MWNVPIVSYRNEFSSKMKSNGIIINFFSSYYSDRARIMENFICNARWTQTSLSLNFVFALEVTKTYWNSNTTLHVNVYQFVWFKCLQMFKKKHRLVHAHGVWSALFFINTHLCGERPDISRLNFKFEWSAKKNLPKSEHTWYIPVLSYVSNLVRKKKHNQSRVR